MVIAYSRYASQSISPSFPYMDIPIYLTIGAATIESTHITITAMNTLDMFFPFHTVLDFIEYIQAMLK